MQMEASVQSWLFDAGLIVICAGSSATLRLRKPERCRVCRCIQPLFLSVVLSLYYNRPLHSRHARVSDKQHVTTTCCHVEGKDGLVPFSKVITHRLQRPRHVPASESVYDTAHPRVALSAFCWRSLTGGNRRPDK